jgi:hypothetical protein
VRPGLSIILVLFLASSAGAQPSGGAPITANPVPAPVEKRGLAVAIADLVRLPDTRSVISAELDVTPRGTARVSFVHDAPDGRRYANDSRGFIYRLAPGEEPALWLDMRDEFPLTNYSRVESGLIGFDFIPPGYRPADVTYHNVITEWRADDPDAPVFSGTHRVLLRVAHVVTNQSHPFGFVGFNPTANRGDDDYGLLFTSGSDLGFSNGGGPNGENPTQTQRLDTVVTAILRIDPRSPAESGGEKGLGDYTIPPGNPYARDNNPTTLGEIYAHGFRNAHRLSWDLADGTMFASDIGMNHIEEINIVRAGGNYGWMAREGYWENGRFRAGALNELWPVPAEIFDGRIRDGYIYPVAFYDHDEGRAISGGFAYRGEIEALQGKFVFGDVQAGRLFVADLAALKAADDGVPGTIAPIEEIQLYVRSADGSRRDVSFMDLVAETKGEAVTRADLHLGQSRDGEIFVTSRQDGMIRTLVR